MIIQAPTPSCAPRAGHDAALAVKLLRSMSLWKLQPDVISYNAVPWCGGSVVWMVSSGEWWFNDALLMVKWWLSDVSVTVKWWLRDGWMMVKWYFMMLSWYGCMIVLIVGNNCSCMIDRWLSENANWVWLETSSVPVCLLKTVRAMPRESSYLLLWNWPCQSRWIFVVGMIGQDGPSKAKIREARILLTTAKKKQRTDDTDDHDSSNINNKPPECGNRESFAWGMAKITKKGCAIQAN